jgi:hypothetical protein
VIGSSERSISRAENRCTQSSRILGWAEGV